MAAPVTDFNSFTAKLNDKFGAGSDEIVTGHIGQNLTRAGAWGEEVFSKAGIHTPAEIGTVMAHAVASLCAHPCHPDCKVSIM